MFEIQKASAAEAAQPNETTMAAINALTRRPLTPEEVYTFSVRACDDQPDRDYERFTADCLKGLLPLYIGKTVIFDHFWSAGNQTARVYGGEIAKDGEATYLRLSCYMLQSEANAPTIAAIDGGILREVSVGCSCGKLTCSICGEPYGTCDHRKGHEYDGKLCIGEISDPHDAYELSFVAVPAQPAAGVCKSAARRGMTSNELDAAKARIRLEKNRF